MTALANSDDLAARLGSTFTDTQTVQADAILANATDLILDAVDKDETWLTAQQDAESVPARLRVTCIEMGVRAFSNPRGVRSHQETLGQASRSESFADASTGLGLSELEVLACRRAVYGRLSASTAMGRTTFDQAAEVADYGRVISGVPHHHGHGS